LMNFLLIQPFNMMWQARMYVVHKRADHQQVFAQVFALYSFLLIFTALGLSLVSREIIRFMVDPRYAAGAQIVGVVALAYVFLGIAYYVQLAMFLGHRTGLIGAVSSVAGVINLGANYFFISRFGMMGAAVATLIAFFVLAIGSYFCSESVLPTQLPVRRVSLGLCTAIAVYFLSEKLNPASLFAAIFLKCLLLAGFAAVLRLWLLSREELATVESLCRSAAGVVARFRKCGFGTT
jgi:O-antigen/teichoic acid export membrane protein